MFYTTDIAEGKLPPEESTHALRVLRLRSGDSIEITDGKGSLYQARITATDKACGYEIISSVSQPKKTYSIHIGLAPTKNIDRTEWFVEKAVELGVDHISFLLCENAERKTWKMERFEKLAISAMKQSRQTWLPAFTPVATFHDITLMQADQKFIAYVDHQNPESLKALALPGKNYLVLIGPEGDFSKKELAAAVAQNFQKVSLGPTRLRTETAGMAACVTLNLAN